MLYAYTLSHLFAFWLLRWCWVPSFLFIFLFFPFGFFSWLACECLCISSSSFFFSLGWWVSTIEWRFLQDSSTFNPEPSFSSGQPLSTSPPPIGYYYSSIWEKHFTEGEGKHKNILREKMHIKRCIPLAGERLKCKFDWGPHGRGPSFFFFIYMYTYICDGKCQTQLLCTLGKKKEEKNNVKKFPGLG